MAPQLLPRKIVWLASYPRSGNTWLRFLLYNLLFGQPTSASDVEDLIPDLHNWINQDSDEVVNHILYYENVILKTHFKFDVFNAISLKSLVENTAGFIYIIRNPLDVLVSNMNYCQLRCSEKINEIGLQNFQSQYVQKFIEQQGDRNWFELGYGNWNEHVFSWVYNSNDLPFIVIRYEDLLNNSFKELERIVNFLALDIEPDAVKVAIENSSFAKMRELENQAINRKEEGMFYRPSYELAHLDNVHFINRGTAGQGQKILSNSQTEQAINAFEESMQQFGYTQGNLSHYQAMALSSDSDEFIGINLHLGGKEKKDNWKILDIESRPEVDFVGDASNLHHFSDNSVGNIYASHILEHFYYGLNNELLNTLTEWHRVLKPGGKLMVSVPDLQTLCWLYVTPGITSQARGHLMRMMFGGQVNQYDVHKVGFDFDILVAYLTEVGFQKVERVPEFNLFSDCSAIRFQGILISLNVIATKNICN